MLLSDVLLQSIEFYNWRKVDLKINDTKDYDLWLYVAETFFGKYNAEEDFNKVKYYCQKTIDDLADHLLVENNHEDDEFIEITHYLSEARLARMLYVTLKPEDEEEFYYRQFQEICTGITPAEKLAKEKALDLIFQGNCFGYTDLNVLKDFSLEPIHGPFEDELAGHTFSTYLFKLISDYGYDEIAVYKMAGFNRQQFSKIRRRSYQPTKITVFALIIAMRLDLNDALELLKYAGYTFSPALKLDRSIEFFVREKIYDMDVINYILFKHNMPLLGSKTRS